MCALRNLLQEKKKVFTESSGVATSRRAWYRASGIFLQQPGTPAPGVNPTGLPFSVDFLKICTLFRSFQQILNSPALYSRVLLDRPVSPLVCQSLNLPRSRIRLVNTVPVIVLLKVLGGEGAEFPSC